MLEPNHETLLIGLGARFYRFEDRLYVENQTISGLKAWQENFSRVIAFSICNNEEPPAGWSDAEIAGLVAPEFELLQLPDTYRIRTLRRSRREAEARLLAYMQRASFRVFSYGGWIGDPGEIAAAQARKNGLSHAVWLDRVESQLVRQHSKSTIPATAKSLIISHILSRYENRAVRNADLALLHGATVYNHFENISRNPQVAENIHLRAEDRISPVGLSEKLKSVKSDPLRILYCGRADPMKGGLEWIRVLKLLKSNGVLFRAYWLGAGSELSEIERQARKWGLAQELVSFPGFVNDRETILQHYRSAHVLMFCHKTDESPRNLIESLHSATPIVGYRDAYAEGLVNEQGGGILVPRGDVEELAKLVAELAADRIKLADLIERASRSAMNLTRDEVFKQRSDLVRRYLNRP
jgi:colanic acid/amylovoran biosynthesis glycosyltransferase